MRGRAQRLSEATTRYREVNGNRREIGSSKFWGKRQRTTHNTCVYAQFCCYLTILTCRWCLFCSEARQGDEVLLQRYRRGNVRVRDSRLGKSRRDHGKWVFSVKDEFAISVAVLIVFCFPFSEPLLRFLSFFNTLFHANPSLRTPKLLSWVSHARSFAGIFSIFTSPFSPWAYFCTRSVQRKTWQSSLTVARKPFGRIAFVLWGCDRTLRNTQFVLTRITSCHVRDSLVLSSFLLISVFLSRSLSCCWVLPVGSPPSTQWRQGNPMDKHTQTQSPNGEVKCTVTSGGEVREWERGKTESGNCYDGAVASPQSFNAPSLR